MSAFASLNAKLRLRAYEIRMRSHGFYPCSECRELTDHRGEGNEYLCEDCAAEATREQESEERYADPRRG